MSGTIPSVIRPGDILCCHDPTSLLALGIEWVEGSVRTHVAWCYEPGMAIQALGRVTKTPLRKFRWDRPEWVTVVRIRPGLVMPSGIAMALAEAVAQEGRGYDVGLFVRLLWAYATKRRGKEPLPSSRRRWICSELIAMPLWEHGHFLFSDNIPPENTTPADIAASNKVTRVWP